MEVNRMGFGGIPIQRVDEKQAVETVLHAVEKGVDFIDTSRAYTTSERRIGIALKQTNKRVIIASKSPQKTSDGVMADWEKSINDLQLDRIDLYQAHFVRDKEDYLRVTGPGGALEGLRKLKEQGKIGHFGMTSHNLDLLELVINDGLFETIMVCYSFIEPLAEEKIFPKAIEKNIGIIAMKSFSGGFIDNANLAIKYALSQPGIVIIPGVDNTSDFDKNWAIFEKGEWSITNEEKRQIEDIRKSVDKVFCRRCDYCQPCTENIPIQQVLGIRSVVKRMGIQALNTGWIKMGIEIAEKCTECGECMTRCPYGLPIPDLIKENIKWVKDQVGSA